MAKIRREKAQFFTIFNYKNKNERKREKYLDMSRRFCNFVG